MDLFALDEEVARLELALSKTSGAARRSLLVPLAWHLRQRESHRALALAEEAEALLAAEYAAMPANPDYRRDSAYLQLVRAEVKYAFGDVEACLALCDEALRTFETLGCRNGAGDARGLIAWCHSHRGDFAARDRCLEAAMEDYAAVGDLLRIDGLAARQLQNAAFGEASAALAAIEQRLPAGRDYPPAISNWRDFALAVCYEARSESALAATYAMRAFEASLQCGRIRAAIAAAGNIAEILAKLHDFDGAFEWLDRGLELANPTGWAASIGACLARAGDLLRRVGRLDEAQAMLDEALRLQESSKGSINYGLLLNDLGNLARDRADHAQALRRYRQAEECQRAAGNRFALAEVLLGQAEVQAHLELPAAALATVEAARALNCELGNRELEVRALRLLANLYRRFPLPPAEGIAGSPSLHYLLAAVDAAAEIIGYIVPGELFDELADEYAAQGDFNQAFALSRRAAAAYAETHNENTRKRAQAMQVRFQLEAARAEARHHKALAAAVRQQAETLLAANCTLETLSAIGREITASLDSTAVCQVLDRHVRAMLDVNLLAILLPDSAGSSLERTFGVDDGTPLPPLRLALDDPRCPAARCFRERQEMLVESDSPVPGVSPASPTRSRLYAPLMVADRVLGVISVQSRRPHAYADRERAILRSLAAFAAVALDNAAAYLNLDHALDELKRTQATLVRQEKLASLGQLVAGVAHEINTPIGVAITAASHLKNEVQAIREVVDTGQLKRSQVEGFLTLADEASTLMLSSTQRAGELINSFKQVAADQAAQTLRRIDLVQYVRDALQTLAPMLTHHGIACHFDGPAQLPIDTYPSAITQLLTNLISNAIVHAFSGIVQPMVVVTVSRTSTGASLTLTDNGTGMSEEVRAKAFDPFFTTRRNVGATGLGLHIAHNLVAGLLGGDITLESEPGRGTSVRVTLLNRRPNG